MPLPDVTDSPELVAIKIDLYNLRAYFMGTPSRENFERADKALKAVWKRFDEYTMRQQRVNSGQ